MGKTNNKSSLRTGCVKKGSGCAPKQHRVGRRLKRLLLDPHEIGLLRLSEMHVNSAYFTKSEVTYIGQCSIDRKYIVVGKAGNHWAIEDCSKHSIRAYKGHGYIIKGKKIIALQQSKQGTIEELMSAYERLDRSKPLSQMRTDEIFSAGKGTKIRKRCGHGEVVYTESYEAVETSRKWRRGERIKMRNANKCNAVREAKQQAAQNVIRAAKYGLIYISNKQAVKLR